MNKYRLKRSYGGLSAGTVVEIVDADEPTSDQVVWVVPTGKWDDDYTEVDPNHLEKCRVQTDEIAVPTREQRREAKDGATEH